ncbi:PilX N-terminal domain-containing pilus assembly protein [Mitsuaria sp. GD03876]|uniref:pilus assembly PilX family protein n=1 Tax=Mitsuaria sp. GD03876 TaxID=2975399 RepID=UPI002446CD6A|nr:PilX N-terminal domain-containing pilus assembly protein [Mitsuaria sp. GD03876]MDH0866678.1 PilX N-terminal domain-containing pilus assembly protein [Mitsuaria sp. GD03876]
MTRRRERGIGTLATCAVMLMVLALGAAWAARQMTTAQRVAANDHRAALAFEAAESGLAWAVAMLNGGAIDAACRPAVVGTATSAAATMATTQAPTKLGGSTALDFRTRFLSIGTDGHYRAPASTDAPPPPTCWNTDALRWTCRCSSGSQGNDDASPAGGAPRPRFSVRFIDGGAPGQLKLIASGCSDQRPHCDDLTDGPSGVAETSQHLALLSALRLPPASARVEGPGSFLQVFGYPPAHYRNQPAIARLRCDGECAGPLAQALARGRRLVWIDGDARLSRWPDEALDGTPWILVVDGLLTLSAPGHPQGVLYARDGIHWHPAAGTAASLRGALVTDGVIDRARSVELIHDRAVLHQLHRRMGSFLPVPGGWTPTR